MKQEPSECSSCVDNDELARQCLRLIKEIAARGARSQDPQQIGFALQELTQALFERAGNDDRVFEPIPPSQISDLEMLHADLDWVNYSAQKLMVSTRQGELSHRKRLPGRLEATA